MINKRGEYWAIKGSVKKYPTLEAASVDYAKMLAKEEVVKERAAVALKKIVDSLSSPTPYEIIIEKNVCSLCNLEPCECLTYTRKMVLGK